MQKLFVLFITVIIAAFASAAPAVFANELGVPPCAYFTRSDVVFYGRVVVTEKAQKSEGLPEGARKIRFQVLENFKGADNPTLTLFADAKSNGGLELKSGQNWIIYAANDIVYKSFTIARGVKIEPKTTNDELALLKEVAAGTSPTLIAGRIVSDAATGRYNFDAAEILLEFAGKRVTAKTDADGFFKFDASSAGKYEIEVKLRFEANIIWPDNLLGSNLQRGTPTVFRYTINLNEGDCNFTTLTVEK